MRFKNPLDKILGQKSKIKILRFLVSYQKDVSIRELSREIKLVPANVSAVLKELENEGLLTNKKFGKSLVFSLKKDSFLTERIIAPLFIMEKEIKAELAKKIIKNIKFRYESMILFGSIAKGGERPQSDIDILFIIANKADVNEIEKQVLAINPAISKYFGNSLSPIVIRKKDFIGKIKKRDKLTASIIKDGEVLSGKIISELL